MIPLLAVVATLHLPPSRVCPTRLPGDGTRIDQGYDGVPHGPKHKILSILGGAALIRQADHQFAGQCAPPKRRA